MGKVINKINSFIIGIAIVLFVIVALVFLLEESLAVPFQIMFHVAAFMTLYYILANILNVLRSLRRRSVRESISLVILIPVVFGVFAFIYLIADGHKVRFDLTASKKFSLSPQTINILDNLKEKITVLAFYKDAQPGREFLKAGLEQYKYHSERIEYEFIDPDRYPQRAKQYGIENYGEVIVMSDKRREKLKDVATEEELTNAILKVTTQEKKVLYFVKGHGEPQLDDMERGGYGLLAQHLIMENYEVKEISLMRTPEVPADASCLIMAAPKTDLFDNEIWLLNKYVLEYGGSLLILADIEVPSTLRELLASWGVTLGKDMIIDKMSQLFGASYEMAIVGKYEPHEITENFNVASFFPACSSLTLADEMPDEFTGQYLAWSGAGSWAETNLEMLEKEDKSVLDEDDKKGPIPLGVVLTKEITKPEPAASDKGNEDSEAGDNQTDEAPAQDKKADKRTAKVVVFGDSDFASNAHLRLSGNKDLFLNTLAWLCGDTTLISIRPKQVDATPLYLTKGQSRMLFFIPVVFFPAFFIMVGVSIFIRRRRV